MAEEVTLADITVGQPIYDADGNELGAVRGIDDAGFYVRTTGTSEVPIADARDILGSTYVMWRCWECGEMGQIDEQLPENCPSCDSPKEDLYYWVED